MGALLRNDRRLLSIKSNLKTSANFPESKLVRENSEKLNTGKSTNDHEIQLNEDQHSENFQKKDRLVSHPSYNNTILGYDGKISSLHFGVDKAALDDIEVRSLEGIESRGASPGGISAVNDAIHTTPDITERHAREAQHSLNFDSEVNSNVTSSNSKSTRQKLTNNYKRNIAGMFSSINAQSFAKSKSDGSVGIDRFFTGELTDQDFESLEEVKVAFQKLTDTSTKGAYDAFDSIKRIYNAITENSTRPTSLHPATPRQRSKVFFRLPQHAFYHNLNCTDTEIWTK